MMFQDLEVAAGRGKSSLVLAIPGGAVPMAHTVPEELGVEADNVLDDRFTRHLDPGSSDSR